MSLTVNNVHEFYKRLTPSHIGLFSYLPKKLKNQVVFNKMQTKHSKSQGDFCVAQETVKQGQLLIKEKPFIRLLSEDRRGDHCSWCFKPMKYANDAECCRDENCVWNIIYCSKGCEQECWIRSHHVLCRFPELMDLEDDILFSFEGYITSLSLGENKIPGLVSNIELESKKSIENCKEKFNRLMKLFYLSERQINSLVEIYFQIKCNTFSVKVIDPNGYHGLIVSKEFVQFGRAIYLSTSKLNHSCNPNSVVSFGEYGDLCEIKVTCVKGPIQGNEEVHISYGPLATKLSKKDRIKHLKENYNFECKCSSCTETTTQSPDQIYQCQYCKKGRLYRQQTRCLNCEQTAYWQYYIKTENEIEEYKRKKDYIKVLELQERIYHQDTLIVGETYDKIAQIYSIERNWNLASKYSKISLKITESIYGKISLEVAEEMMKLSSLLFNAQKRNEAIKQIQATIILYKILGLNQSAPDDIEELEIMKSQLIF